MFGLGLAIMFIFFMLIFAIRVSLWIHENYGLGRESEPRDPNAPPGPIKATLLKAKSDFSRDENNLTYCSSCNKHMLRLYDAEDRPTNKYRCPGCGHIVKLVAV